MAVYLDFLDLEFDAAKLEHVARHQLVHSVADVAVDIAHHNEHALTIGIIGNFKTIVASSDHQHSSCLFHTDKVVPCDQLDFVVVANKSAASYTFDVFLGDIFGLVVKKTIAITSPRNTTHKNFCD